MNGSWFALTYVLDHQDLVMESNHGLFRILSFQFAMFWSRFNMYVSYISIALFYIIVSLNIEQLEDSLGLRKQGVFTFHSVFTLVYILSLGGLIYYSLNFDARQRIA